MSITYFFIIFLLHNNLPIMVSSPVNNNLWAYRVPENQVANNDNMIAADTRVYGDPDVTNHRMRPGNWSIGRTIKTYNGATINVEAVACGMAIVGIWYPNGLGAEYEIFFPQGHNIDDVASYAIDPEQNILYIDIGSAFYSVNLDDARYGDAVEFVRV